MKTMRTVITIALLLAAQNAFAQGAVPLDSRVYLSIDGGYQGGTRNFTNSATFAENQEEARFDGSYEVKSGPQFQVAAGAALWRNLNLGVAVSRFSRTTPTHVTASIPHPFFFNRGRAIDGDVTGVTREELTVHMQARAVAPVSTRLSIAVFGGPSWFTVKQGLVGGVAYSDTFPYDTAAFASATTSTASASRIGFNVGADVAFFVVRNLGVGGTLQLSRAEMELPAGDAPTVNVVAGGLQGGVGLRMRF